MGLSNCEVITNSSGKELTAHGIAMFPLACYDEDFSRHLVPWHWHDDFEIILITEGCAHIMVENQCVPVKAGNAILVNSGLLHSVNAGLPEPAHCHSIVFHPRLIGGSIDSIFWQKLVHPITEGQPFHWLLLDAACPWQAEVIDSFDRAWQAALLMPEHFEITIRYLLSCAFYTLIKNLPTQEQDVSEKDRLAAERTKAMMQYIHEHYTEETTLSQIAGSAAISESVCLRSFRRAIGVSPIQYILQYRLERAAELLSATDAKAKDIALAVGFSDFSYFTKVFRKVKGCTPIEYRKRCGAKA